MRGCGGAGSEIDGVPCGDSGDQFSTRQSLDEEDEGHYG